MAETTTRFFSSRLPQPKRLEHRRHHLARRRARAALHWAGEPGVDDAVNSGSRSLRLSWVTRRLRVTMLNANCSGSWWVYWPRFSNHSRLAWAARWVDATTGRRSASYASSAASELRLLVQARRQRQRVLHGQLGA